MEIFHASTTDDLPAPLLSLETNARPAVLLVGHEILGALDIGNDVSSSGLEGGSAGLHGPLNIDGALDGQGLWALVSTDYGHGLLASELRLGLPFREGVKHGDGAQGGDDGNQWLVHGGVFIIIHRKTMRSIYSNQGGIIDQ